MVLEVGVALRPWRSLPRRGCCAMARCGCCVAGHGLLRSGLRCVLVVALRSVDFGDGGGVEVVSAVGVAACGCEVPAFDPGAHGALGDSLEAGDLRGG